MRARSFSTRARLTPKSRLPSRDAERTWSTPAFPVVEQLDIVDIAEQPAAELGVKVTPLLAHDRRALHCTDGALCRRHRLHSSFLNAIGAM